MDEDKPNNNQQTDITKWLGIKPGEKIDLFRALADSPAANLSKDDLEHGLKLMREQSTIDFNEMIAVTDWASCRTADKLMTMLVGYVKYNTKKEQRATRIYELNRRFIRAAKNFNTSVKALMVNASNNNLIAWTAYRGVWLFYDADWLYKEQIRLKTLDEKDLFKKKYFDRSFEAMKRSMSKGT